MPRKQRDWLAWVKEAHEERTGVGEGVLGRLDAGAHSPYRWLARAVSTKAVRILDDVCGSGAMTRQLQAPGREIVGVDWRARELELAAQRSGGEWVCADARDLPFPDDSFDAVVSALGLALVHPTDRFVGEAARVLKPGGVLAMMAPALVPLNSRDVATLAQVSARLGSRPRLPGVAHRAEIDLALGMHRLRRIEARRERYRFRVANRADAEAIIHSLYLPPRAVSRKRAAVDYLTERAEREGAVTIAIPMRRIVAIK